MSWLTVGWSICAGLCFMLALLHLMLWIKNRTNYSYLLSTLMASSAGASALVELALMQTQSIQSYATLMKLEVSFIYLLLMSLVWLVSVQLGPHRRWPACVITATWSAALVFNFLSPGSLVYEQVEQINRAKAFWGEDYSVGTGPANPWNMLANAGVVLIIIYVFIAAKHTWRHGRQRRAALLGGSIIVFMTLAGTHSVLVDTGLIATPYMVSFAYLAIVMAMSYELVSQAIQVPALTRELASYQRRWQSFLDNVQLAVIAIDTEGRITYTNTFLQKLTGYAEDELLHKPAAMLTSAPEHDNVQQRLQLALDQGPRPHSQRRILCSSGEQRHLAWSSVRQFDSDGRVAGLVSIGSDLTDQIRAQHELHEIRREMERIMRANTLGELASTMAHELNQPLTAILSNAQAARRMLTANKLEPNELGEILDDIVRDDKRAGEIIHGMRAFLRRSDAMREAFSADDMIAEVLRILKSELEAAAVQVSLDIEPGMAGLYANRLEMLQVLVNLVVNAIRAQRALPEDKRSIVIRVSASEDKAIVKVRDHGPGIQADAAEKMFEPFFSTRRDGLGMGLALSRRIVEAHGGTIRAENHPQGGAEFSFSIPLDT